jgi:hypothetical protein
MNHIDEIQSLSVANFFFNIKIQTAILKATANPHGHSVKSTLICSSENTYGREVVFEIRTTIGGDATGNEIVDIVYEKDNIPERVLNHFKNANTEYINNFKNIPKDI